MALLVVFAPVVPGVPAALSREVLEAPGGFCAACGADASGSAAGVAGTGSSFGGGIGTGA